MDSSKRIADVWMPPLYSRRNIKRSVRASRTWSLNYFSRKAEWEASDQWTTRSLIYRRPKQTDRGTCIEFFIRIALVFFSVARVLFKNSCERPVASILPWKIERPFRIHERKCSVSKMHVVTLVLLSVLLFRAFQYTHGYNILGICPSASYSHQQPFQALMKALAARGHNVTVASTIPLKVHKFLFLSPHIFSLTLSLSSSYLSIQCMCVCIYVYYIRTHI